MNLIKFRHDKITQALKTLEIAVQNLKHLEAQPKPETLSCPDHDEMHSTYRDSMIHRFEYCTDLFWKYLNKYLEEHLIQQYCGHIL